jgi:hypothetical protein
MLKGRSRLDSLRIGRGTSMKRWSSGDALQRAPRIATALPSRQVSWTSISGNNAAMIEINMSWNSDIS